MEAVDLDVLRTCARWMHGGHQVVLVTVIRTWGSSPRPPGAMMAIRNDGAVVGSVSGGCIEDDLIEKVRAGGIGSLAQGGLPCVHVYGVLAEQAHRFGLPCGGTLQLAMEPLSKHSRIEELVARLEQRRSVRRELNLHTGIVTLHTPDKGDGLRFDGERLILVLGAGYRLIVIGAGQLSRYLCQTAVGLGFDVTVCDPREEYRSDWQLEGVRLVTGMPDDVVLDAQADDRTAVVALTHDPKLDDLALMDALRSPAFYVGALGSRANHARRVERLREHFGLTDDELGRLRGPAGLYLGSRTPPEIALSILAEIVAVKNGVPIEEQFTVGCAKRAREVIGSGAACELLPG